MRIEWSDQSLEDVESIHSYIAGSNPGNAERFVDRIFASVDRLIDHPESGRMVPEFEDPALREIILGRYRIIHDVRGDTISIVTVFHSARLLKPEHLGEFA